MWGIILAMVMAWNYTDVPPSRVDTFLINGDLVITKVWYGTEISRWQFAADPSVQVNQHQEFTDPGYDYIIIYKNNQKIKELFVPYEPVYRNLKRAAALNVPTLRAR